FLDAIVSASYGERYQVHLALWEGVNRVLLMSAVAIVAGLAIARFHRSLPGIPWLRANSEAATQGVLDGMTRLADRVERLAQPGSLPLYLAIALSAAVVPVVVLVAAANP